ncbi:MAG: GNAT family N-acetyltransferase [Chloroflexi bacterium]|nr:GNAT family N-acetyltransferase [Chloroflexota bacterium]
MGEITLRPYRPEDEPGVVAVWNRALSADRISAATWRARVLLDPNFDPALCLVAQADGVIRGFGLALTRQIAFFGDPPAPDQAWITALAVDPEVRRQGIGGQILRALLDLLRARGCRAVTVASYVPNYFAPGVDVEAYPQGVPFLERYGFTVISRPVGMFADLEGYTVPAGIQQTLERIRSTGIAIGPAEPRDILPTLGLIRRHFSWDWWREAQEVFRDLFCGDPRGVGLVVARQGERILGYAQHRGEHFGPFGVDPDHRGQGIGRALLAETLIGMTRQGFHCAWFLWTSEETARGVYAACGFQIRRRFAILRASLAGDRDAS